MESADNYAPVRIASSPSAAAARRAMVGGISGLVGLSIAISALLSRRWDGLFIIVLPAAMLALARWLELTTPAHAVVLYADRFEIPRRTKEPLVVAWSEVTSICWPKNPGVENTRVRLALRKHVAHVYFDLKDVSPADRLIVIEYLHRAARGVKQQNWEAFCHKRAVPLAEAPEGKEAGFEATIATPRWFQRLEQYPFLCGLFTAVLFGPLVAYILTKAVSRTTYWIMAAMICASAFINIRLVWRRWASPFTEICLGTAAVCFLLGVFASAGHSSKLGRSTPLALVIASYVPAFIACPLFVNAAAIGWIPRPFDAVLTLASLVMYFCAALFVLDRERRRRKKRDERLEADAVRRWEIYQATGSLPPAADDKECE